MISADTRGRFHQPSHAKVNFWPFLMLVANFRSWWHLLNFAVRRLFEKIADAGDQNGQNRHQHLKVVTNIEVTHCSQDIFYYCLTRSYTNNYERHCNSLKVSLSVFLVKTEFSKSLGRNTLKSKNPVRKIRYENPVRKSGTKMYPFSPALVEKGLFLNLMVVNTKLVWRFSLISL